MDEALNKLGAYLAGKLGPKQTGFEVARGELTIEVKGDSVPDVIAFLRDDERCRFGCLIDICGVDYPDRDERFDVVYHLLSPWLNQRIRVRAKTRAETPVPSIVDLFPAANWFEREAYDLYGILFEGHPDLRRLLTDYGFQGRPLRKDFPLDQLKRVVYEPVKLMQEFRTFDFLSPWEGMDTAIPGDEKAGEAPDRKGES
jgi:NADH-quinone oxidoreductase subunit C